MTEVQAQEIEERRNQRAALAAKLAEQSPAPSKPSSTPERSHSCSPHATVDILHAEGTIGPQENGEHSGQRAGDVGPSQDVEAVVVADDSGKVLDAIFRRSADAVCHIIFSVCVPSAACLGLG
jgi:hypothetical protein